MKTCKTVEMSLFDQVLPDGSWLDHLDPSYLAKTYPSWASDVSTVEEAARAFRRQGFLELAALADGLHFDPAYYAEANPAWEGASDLERYRSWLIEGIPAGRPGSPVAHLRKLGLSLESYPSAFPWEYYAHLRPYAGAHRWAALEDFCASGFELLGDKISFGPTASEFLIALGCNYSGRNDKLAIRAYELARSWGPLPAAEEQHLADAYLREGLWRPALDLYRGIIRDAKETTWTVRNLIKCASRLEQWSALFADIEVVRPRLIGHPLWFEVAREAIDAIFERHARQARTLMAAGHYADADELLSRSVAHLAELIASLNLPLPRGGQLSTRKVLILSNEHDGHNANRRVSETLVLLDQQGLQHEVMPFEATEQFAAELPNATLVILFHVPALPSVLRCIIAARQLGVPVYYHSDAALLDPGDAPDIAAFRGLLTSDIYDDLRFGMPLFRAAARLCDFGIAPTGRLADTLRPLVQSGRTFVIRDAFAEKTQAAHTPLGRERPNLRLFLRVATLAFLDAAPDTIVEQLLAVLQRRPELEFYVSGALHLDRRFDLCGGRIHHIRPGGAAGDYRPYLAASDVNLVVRCATLDDEYLAEISWSEAAAYAVPSLMFMPAGILPELRHEENVLRAAEASCWAAALERLLGDSDLRERVATQARRDASILHASAQNARALNHALAEGQKLARTI